MQPCVPPPEMIEPIVLTPISSPRWATARARLGPGAPEALALLGDPALLESAHLTALFCSQRAPASVLLQAHDLARGWRRGGPLLIGGFQSLVEREVLDALLPGSQPLVLVRSRPVPQRWRPPPEQRAAWEAGRLLIVAPERGGGWGRGAATARNRLAAALADEALVLYAEPGGATWALTHELLARGQPVYTLAGSWSAELMEAGAREWGEERGKSDG